MNHKSKNSHHCSTAVVQLNSSLGKLGLLIEGVPSEIDELVTEVTWELSSSDVLHNEKLKESNESYDLKKSSLWDSVYCCPSVRDGVEGSSCSVNVSWEVDSSTSDDVSKECKLGDTSVLDLDVTEAVKTLLGGVVEEAERVEEKTDE